MTSFLICSECRRTQVVTEEMVDVQGIIVDYLNAAKLEKKVKKGYNIAHVNAREATAWNVIVVS